MTDMLNFASDYVGGAHPKVLSRLVETNGLKTPGYGTDEFCESAKKKILDLCKRDGARVYFLVGGTQTNATVISSILRGYQGVISAALGHIATHESGAIEATGHKVITLPEHDGKLLPSEVDAAFRAYFEDESREHTVMPGAVYVSHPTEVGTLYTKDELRALSEICHRNGAYLFLDGARLGYGLMAEGTDLTLSDIAAYTDVFYIGGTKVGALFGEAVVVTDPELCPFFVSSIKQHGALLAKGRLLGVQFDALFSDGLYFEISRAALDAAKYLKSRLISLGYKFLIDSPTNQQFVIIENDKIDKIREKVICNFWQKYDEKTSVLRFVTSFDTTREDIDALISLM